MGFWNIATFGLAGALFPKKKKEDPYAQLMSQLQPLIDQNKKISGAAGEAGLSNIAAARDDYDYVNKYLKTILTGSDDELLKIFDAAGATRNADENEQMQSELGVRGGARAASLGNASFSRDASIDRVLKQLRFAAPGQISQISQAIGNLGLGELSASTGAGAQASNVLFGVEQLKQADADRKAALIRSIFSALGSTAGALAGSA